MYEYTRHLFAYLDILGFEELVKDKSNLRKLARLLESIHENQAFEKKENNLEGSSGTAKLIPNIMCFSDNIIISIRHENWVSESALSIDVQLQCLMHSVITYVSNMCLGSLGEGIALRGAVGYGDIYIDYTDKKSIILARH